MKLSTGFSSINRGTFTGPATTGPLVPLLLVHWSRYYYPLVPLLLVHWSRYYWSTGLTTTGPLVPLLLVHWSRYYV